MSEKVAVEKKKIKKLVELNEELENYFRNTIIPQLFVDADLILRKFSPPANTHFKLAENHIGISIIDIPALSQLDGLIEVIKEVIATNIDFEDEIQTPDKRWFQMNILPYIIKKKDVTNGVVITFVDITGRINDKKIIERINADHETFIYSVTHDLKGPVSNVISLVDLLNHSHGDELTEEIQEYLKMIKNSAYSLKEIISELTHIAKVGTEMSDQAATVNIEQILEDVKLTLKNQIYQSHAKITTNIIVPEIQFSKKNLRSILYNLIFNAIKFSKNGTTPEIFIKTEESGEYSLLSVKDNGVGIEPEKKEEIFSKFTRLKPHIEGTGLGLFIINKMVTNQGGKIEVESEVDNYTTFNIYLKQG
ncbi:ATP-binding protein [Marivirga salinae]|uniref:histidine kinase n=1 Tax=Marivirga salinarum TaxID=3059078 RepID=A0AA51N8L6_9BACT|nr:ATP-binding protein [Marivirga sp. BDSF4-3]WMN10836.1 ATP-binding protein [Marivirga sp. BDSF4-3]